MLPAAKGTAGSARPARVVGFDISERIIQLARTQEERDPLGIE